MADRTVNIGVGATIAGGFDAVKAGIISIKDALVANLQSVAQLKGNVINFAAMAQSIEAVDRSFGKLQKGVTDLADAYAIQEVAEKKLETVMQARMGASEADIQSIKELASAQQELGVIGDEVQLAGAQQVATFLHQKESLTTLMPAMNNLLAQQKGLKATGEDAANIGNLFGKAMMGQVDALKRVGISFSEAEANVLKYGTESEKAAMLAHVVEANVGNMNEALAQTDSGKQQQLLNTLGDLKEEAGKMVNVALPFVEIAAQGSAAVSSISTLVMGISTLTKTLFFNTKAFITSTLAFVKNRGATLACAAAQKTVAAASKAWIIVQKALNFVLSANPIGLVIMAIGALVTGIIYAYNHCETFRNVINSVWSVIEPFAKMLWDKVVAAIQAVCKYVKIAWTWLAKLLGISGKEVEVKVKVTPKKTSSDVSDLIDKYKNYSEKGTKTGKGQPVKAAAHYTELPKTLKELKDNISWIDEHIQGMTSEEAQKWVKLREQYSEQVSNFGKVKEAVVEVTDTLHESCNSLADFDDNIRYLQDRLQHSNVEAAKGIRKQLEETKKARAAMEAQINGAPQTATFNEQAQTLNEIESNLSILQEQLKNATINEAAQLNRTIALWERKRDAIKNAGKEAEKESIGMREGFSRSWGAVKGLSGAIGQMQNSIRGSGKAWEKLVGVVDAFVSMVDNIHAIIGLFKLLGIVSKSNTAAKVAETAAEGTYQGVAAVGAAQGAAQSVAQITANKIEAASWRELAAAKYMAATAMIPFVGLEIGAAMVAEMMAITIAAGVPALANGGLANGPTLALVGEYAGASSNPEVIAPLDKLKGMLKSEMVQVVGGDLRVRGRDLVTVLANETRLNGGKTKIRI